MSFNKFAWVCFDSELFDEAKQKRFARNFSSNVIKFEISSF